MEALEALVSLRRVLEAERENYKEKLAAGHKGDDLPGRCQGLKWAIEKIGEQIKSVRTRDGDDI